MAEKKNQTEQVGKQDKAKVILGSLVIGAALGSIASLLLAPQEGRKTRQLIGKLMAKQDKKYRRNKKKSKKTTSTGDQK